MKSKKGQRTNFTGDAHEPDLGLHGTSTAGSTVPSEVALCSIFYGDDVVFQMVSSKHCDGRFHIMFYSFEFGSVMGYIALLWQS